MGYGTFAKYYNMYWTSQAPQLFEEAFDKILLEKLNKGDKVLDLCCGTGQICNILAGKGFQTAGLDISESMLDIAKKNAPAATFLHDDARTFRTEGKYRAVVSFFDSINHMLSESDLFSTFKSVKKSLDSGGLFLFDVNDEEVFNSAWEEGFTFVEDDHACIMKPTYDETTGRATYQITLFWKEKGQWLRRDTRVYEQYYSSAKLLTLLNNAGFNNTFIYSGNDDLGMPHFSGRIFFMAEA